LCARLEAREHHLLLLALVIVLDEASDQLGAVLDRRDVEVTPGLEPPAGLAVHQQHAAQDAVLAHQVLSGTDVLFRLLLLFGFLRVGSRRAQAVRPKAAPAPSRISPPRALFRAHGPKAKPFRRKGTTPSRIVI
jgi:hypothetical protein